MVPLYTPLSKASMKVPTVSVDSTGELTDRDPLNASMSDSGISIESVPLDYFDLNTILEQDESLLEHPDEKYIPPIDIPDEIEYHQYNDNNIVLSADNDIQHQRIYNMAYIRCKLADSHLLDKPCIRELVFDDKYTNGYSKGLSHNSNGFVSFDQFNSLIYALNTQDINELPCTTLINPSAAWSIDIIGKCNNSYRYSKIPDLGRDMIQLYYMSLCRDIPFDNYDNHGFIKESCSYLGCGSTSIFRLPMPSCKQGSYLSKLLQQYHINTDRADHMTSWNSAIETQNCNGDNNFDIKRSYRPINTGRDLAWWVYHNDPIDIFSDTAKMLLQLKVPVRYQSMEKGYINFGSADIQSTLYIIGRSALSAAWYVKWNTLVPRPEAYGIEVERVYRTHRNKYGVSPELLKNKVMNKVRSVNGSGLLSQVYPYGSPLSPSMVSGYATVAGACATVLKFFFDTDHVEIDKLAFNVAIGRCWAGVNYYNDAIAGLKRGEQVALSCLHELVYRYPNKVTINIKRFNGKISTVSN